MHIPIPWTAPLLTQAAPVAIPDWMIWTLVIAVAVLVLLILSRRQDEGRHRR